MIHKSCPDLIYLMLQLQQVSCWTLKQGLLQRSKCGKEKSVHTKGFRQRHISNPRTSYHPGWEVEFTGGGISKLPSARRVSPSVFPSIRVFSNESALHLRWPKYWSFGISPSNEYSRLISFWIHQFDLLAVQGTLKSLLQHQNLKVSIF